jgi:hypothetical protein
MPSHPRADGRRSETRARFVTARDPVGKAINAHDRGDNRTAIETWKRLFGTSFPSYGWGLSSKLAPG